MHDQPQRYLQRMVLFLGFIAVGAVALGGRLAELFAANPTFNAIILLVLLFGVVLDLRRVLYLRREHSFLHSLQAEMESGTATTATASLRAATTMDEATEPTDEFQPRLLAGVATLLRARKGRTISALSMRTLQDSIQARVNESHEISRYLIGLLIFLGLLGTFWGLAEATASVGQVIANLSVQSNDAAELFASLKEGLQAPLSGMGTAFSTSLFGLSGSLILGFLELQSAQAHNRFLEELEEWLTGMTRLSGATLGGETGEAGAGVPAYVQALLEQTADSLDRLQRTIQQGEGERQQVERALTQLSDRLSVLTDRLASEGDSTRKQYEVQAGIRSALERLGEAGASSSGGLDKASREHLRSLDTTLRQVTTQLVEGHEAITRTLRDELRLFARTLATALDEVHEAKKADGASAKARGKDK